MYWYQTDKFKYIVIAWFVVVILTLIPLILYIGGKEDPKFISYSCNKHFASNDTLKHDQQIKVTSARSYEESINIFNLFSSLSSRWQLTSDVNTILSTAKQIDADKNTSTITIPNHACFISMKSNQQGTFTSSFESSLPNLSIYNWVKTTKNYFSNEQISTNIIMLLDDSAISIQFNGSPNFFNVIKAKIAVYSLNLSTDNNPSQI
ncbi:hypothetical protein GCM10008014_00680 [Paenibacillus silvae]|uniref:Uncharacterized protein n=1 Tax=Paenibacillus silvae TaxID=1325358 RepID=A0ABQ1YWC0_9BACL|nr:hypothetical protein [Paenibacillus silvae]GGH41276.1 hypothetical protein GCM10008014_00680 [Paenibacillus silvae]